MKEPTRHKPRSESVRGASSSRAWQGGRGAAHRAYTPKGKGGIPSARQAAEDEAAWRRGGAGGRVPPPVHAARDAASAEAARVASERADELRRKKVEEQEIYRRVRAETAAEMTAAHERAEEGRVLAAAALAETNELRVKAVKAQQAAEAALEIERAARGPAGGRGRSPPPSDTADDAMVGPDAAGSAVATASREMVAAAIAAREAAAAGLAALGSVAGPAAVAFVGGDGEAADWPFHATLQSGTVGDWEIIAHDAGVSVLKRRGVEGDVPTPHPGEVPSPYGLLRG